jgi:speckle-type POZ protein
MRDLDAHDASLVTRRLLACSDREHGRITDDQYREAIAAIDKQWTPRPPVQPQPAIVWASTVRGFSSQYSTSSWSAAQALGAPNVFPGGGDNASAWASLGADDRDEWLEVGFDRPGSVSGVEIYETYNPGAVDRVELITQNGRIIETQPSALAPGGASARRIVTVECTREPIVAARVHIASMRVAGWNEIDAIGVVPCTR